MYHLGSEKIFNSNLLLVDVVSASYTSHEFLTSLSIICDLLIFLVDVFKCVSCHISRCLCCGNEHSELLLNTLHNT